MLLRPGLCRLQVVVQSVQIHQQRTVGLGEGCILEAQMKMEITPDLEQLSHSEPNVQAKVLGVLLGADYRSCFLPRFLERAGVETSADWAAAGSQAVFFTRPVYAYLREQAATVEDAESAQAEINRFLGLPPTFELRRNTDGKLTHPRGWNSTFVLHMLDDNPDAVGQVGKDRVAAKLRLMEEVANTEVDLILQAGTTTIFCELKWLSGFGPPSRKPALNAYGVDQMHRQYLAGLYLTHAAGCDVLHLVLTSELAGKTRHVAKHTGRLAELVPAAAESATIHQATWQDVYEVAEECLPPGHELLAYMRGKRAHRGKRSVPLLGR